MVYDRGCFVVCSEEEAKRSIYSVSTKYYYAFGCRVHEPLTYKIRCIVTYPSKILFFFYILVLLENAVKLWLMCLVAALPDVRWVLPDSYVVDGDCGYGGLVCCSSYI